MMSRDSGVDLRDSNLRALSVLLVVFSVLIGTGTLILLIIRWPGKITPEYESLLIRALAPLATLLLAIPTAISVRQNYINNRELIRDRERPIAIDEINNLISPAINDIESSISYSKDVEHKPKFDWYYSNGSNQPYTYTSLGTVFPWLDSNYDRTAIRYFREDDPELFELMREQDRLVEEASRSAEEISEQIRPKVRRYISEEDIVNESGERPDVDVLCSAILRNLDSYGESHPDYEVWENHGDELIDILRTTAGGKHQNLQETERELIAHSEQLLDALYQRRITLRRRYGISSSDLSSNHIVRV